MSVSRFFSHALTAAAGVVVLVQASTAWAAPPSDVRSVFVTLGTMGGPVPDAERSQPANAILRGERIYLVDAGDGATGQLGRAGLALPAVRAVFLSHLHIDHTGGLAAIIGLRLQTETRAVLQIYGPPGTHELVAGILASLRPAANAGYGTPGHGWADPSSIVNVIELQGGETVQVDDFTLRAVQNTHYDFVPGSAEDGRYKSLSFRFTLPDRSIVYTGDTGPSQAVEMLAQGADLLVSEMIDLDSTLGRMARVNPNMPADVKSAMVQHLSTHHLTAAEVGRLAARAKVKSVVITHFAGGLSGPDQVSRSSAAVKQTFLGPVTVAKDLDRF